MKNPLIWRHLCAGAFAVFLSGITVAQESRLPGQALHCAAVFGVLAESGTADLLVQTKAAKAVELLTGVYRQEIRDQGGLQEAERRLSDLMQGIRETISSREARFREDVVICGAWAEGFWGQGPSYQYVPVYPKVIAPSVRSQYQTLLNKVFSSKAP